MQSQKNSFQCQHERITYQFLLENINSEMANFNALTTKSSQRGEIVNLPFYYSIIEFVWALEDSYCFAVN